MFIFIKFVSFKNNGESQKRTGSDAGSFLFIYVVNNTARNGATDDANSK